MTLDLDKDDNRDFSKALDARVTDGDIPVSIDFGAKTTGVKFTVPELRYLCALVRNQPKESQMHSVYEKLIYIELKYIL